MFTYYSCFSLFAAYTANQHANCESFHDCGSKKKNWMLCLRRFLSSSSRLCDGVATATTHFGRETVPIDQKESRVREVFNRTAHTYDLMNDLMSGGIHRLWKAEFVNRLGPYAGMNLLDVAGGTGDVAFRCVDAIRQRQTANGDPYDQRLFRAPAGDVEPSNGQRGTIYVADINTEMLRVGKSRAIDRGCCRENDDDSDDRVHLKFVEANAEQLPFDDASMDAYTIAFGIRNVTRIERALDEAYRVLKPGGRFMCLEFSRVNDETLRQLYDEYSDQVIPTLGDIVAKDRDSYQYLVDSIRRFPSQRRFAKMIRAAGLRGVSYDNLTFGVVAIHSGFKV
jgi:2-methoxy-6-polyprenyl-1,4-benzoquinol methylase